MAFNFATAGTFVGPSGNLAPAKGYGLGGQFIFYPIQDLGISAGYLRRNAYDYADYTKNVTTVTQNFQKYNTNTFANISYDLNAAIRLAVEYEYLNTHYGNVKDLATEVSSILNGNAPSGSCNIASFAAYYFF